MSHIKNRLWIGIDTSRGGSDTSSSHPCSGFGGQELLCLPPSSAPSFKWRAESASPTNRPPRQLTSSSQQASGDSRLCPPTLCPCQWVVLSVSQHLGPSLLCISKRAKRILSRLLNIKNFQEVHKSLRSTWLICATYISFTDF